MRPALFAGDEHLGDGGGFRIGEDAVHVAHEITAEGDQEEDAEAAAGEADEDGLGGMGIELQDVEGWQREDGARDHRPSKAANAGDDHVFEHRGAAGIETCESDGEDRDRDGGLHDLADFEPGVGRRDGEDHAEEESPGYRAGSEFAEGCGSRYHRLVRRAGRQGRIGVGGESFGGVVNDGHGVRLRVSRESTSYYEGGRRSEWDWKRA